MKKKIILKEQDLQYIVEECVASVLNENVNEGWFKNACMAGAMGTASMFGGNNQAMAQNTIPNNNNNTQTTQVAPQKMTVEMLKKLCPQAYKDRNANPQVWQRNQSLYTFQSANGHINLYGKLAASIGQNPWQELLRRFNLQDNDIFKLDSFDI